MVDKKTNLLSGESKLLVFHSDIGIGDNIPQHLGLDHPWKDLLDEDIALGEREEQRLAGHGQGGLGNGVGVEKGDGLLAGQRLYVQDPGVVPESIVSDELLDHQNRSQTVQSQVL